MPGSRRKKYARSDETKFVNIPERLRALPQWVVWRAVWKEERDTYSKVPYTPATGREAKSNQPATWGTFSEAVEKFARDPNTHGIGFEFSAQDPFTFVDLDDARDPETGDVGDWAQQIVDKLNSYTEVSPSGTGLRILVEAEPVGPAKRRGKVEMYSFGQYATITGAVVRDKPIEPRQGQLADLYALVFGAPEPDTEASPREPAPVDDAKLARVKQMTDDELFAKATGAANGAKFLALWEGQNIADRSQADASLCAILAYWTRADAERVDKLFRLSKLMRKKWDERRGDQTYGQRTVAFACRGATALYDPDVDTSGLTARNDESNAQIFIELYNEKFSFCKQWDLWLSWTGKTWRGDDLTNAQARIACGEVRSELLRRIRGLTDNREIMAAAKWANSSGDRYRLNALEDRAKLRMLAPYDQFNHDGYALGCANGVIDLRTGELRDGARADWITRSTELVFDPKQECPLFEKFMREIMQGDKNMISYLWRVIGYALTGDVTERAFFLFHGEGRNGKSTFVETLKALLGPSGRGYAQKARFSTFLRKSFVGGANDDVAHLGGARVVVASEADERNPLDVALVKELTGGDTHRARFLYGREFEFAPQFKLFLVTNKVPPIHETTYAIWDRLHYVPFEWRVPDGKVDRALPLKLLGELPGILAHAVRACLEWQTDGLAPPEKVLQAGQQLYKEMDTIGEFISEECEVGDATKLKETHKDLYARFTRWCQESGLRYIPSSKTLGSYLREKRFTDRRLGKNILFWLGIRLAKKSEGRGGEI